MGPGRPGLGGEPVVEGMHGELDEPIREAAGTRPLVTDAGAPAQWLEGTAHRSPADRIEDAVQGNPAVLARRELEPPGVDRGHLLGQHRSRIGGVASVGAVEAETADRVLEGELEQGTLPKLAPLRLRARSVPASRARWANPRRPASSAATLAGSCSAASPVAIERAAAVPDIRH
jgi:hypothetical protein